MADIKEQVVGMLNQALELEQAARIQYLTHAGLLKGICAEPIISRLKEIASDEASHEEKFRGLIADYLGEEPAMTIAPAHKAKETEEILKVNLKGEKEAVDFYKQIYQKVISGKGDFPYGFETLEHEIRHIIIDEQEHIAELSLLLGR